MLHLLGVSRPSLYRWVKKGAFPKPLMYGGRTMGWSETDYLNWLSRK
ncbi:helix-turn-helix transcriptional regulator [Dongshaea marina]